MYTYVIPIYTRYTTRLAWSIYHFHQARSKKAKAFQLAHHSYEYGFGMHRSIQY